MIKTQHKIQKVSRKLPFHVFVNNSFTKNSHAIKFTVLKVYNSMLFNLLRLYNYHYYLISEHFHDPKKNPYISWIILVFKKKKKETRSYVKFFNISEFSTVFIPQKEKILKSLRPKNKNNYKIMLKNTFEGLTLSNSSQCISKYTRLRTQHI